jgi:hypothetical protein
MDSPSREVWGWWCCCCRSIPIVVRKPIVSFVASFVTRRRREGGTLLLCMLIVHSCKIQHEWFVDSPIIRIGGNDAIKRLGRSFANDPHFG